MNYKMLRKLYYFGILVLILNALPSMTFLEPILSYQIVNGITVVGLIAIAVLIGAFQAYRRKFG